MNATVFASLLVASAAALAVSLSLRSPDVATAPDRSVELQRAVDELRATAATMQRRIEAIENAPMPATSALVSERTAVPVVNADQVALAVEAYLAQRRDGGPVGAEDKKSTFDLAIEFESLKGKNYWEDTAAWKRAFAAGRMDDVIKQCEALAKASPNDIAAQMSLANAYMAYLQMDQSKWELSMKADKVFDRVLELDETHWEARFTKAVSYTFYPDFLGKKKDAIAHFETLVAQQEQQPIQSHHAETYLYLGNLLEARDPARAKEMWAKGARRHPDNAELVKKAGG